MNQLPLRIAEAGLILAIWAGVLAFGGTSPPFFLPTQIIILGLGVFLLSASFYRPVTATRLPLVVPMLLIALVVLQIVPLPPFLARLAFVDTVLAHGVRPTLSFAPYQTVSQLLLLVTYLTAFCLVLLVKEDRGAKKRLVYALVALGAFEAFYGLAQYLTGWQQIFAYVKKYYVEDATGTYINRNHFAGFLEMALPLTLALALHFAGKLRTTAQPDEVKLRNILSSPQLPPLVFLIFLFGVMFTALIFSRSRMGIIAGIFSASTVLALVGSSSVSRRTRTLIAVLFILGIAGVVLC